MIFLMITREMQVNGDSLVTNLGEDLTVESTGLNGETEGNSVITKLDSCLLINETHLHQNQ